jgi:hypothetical protein
MAICGCGLPARCCQPAVAGGIIYADLWGELNTHMALQALFTQSSPVRDATATSTLAEVTHHPLSQACVFIYSSHGKWVFPPLLWGFPPSITLTSFPTSVCWACAAAPAGWHVCLQLTWEVGPPPSCGVFLPLPLSQAFLLLVAGCAPAPTSALSSQAWFVYLQFLGGILLPPLWLSGLLTIFATCLYCSYCLLLSFSFFPRWGSVCPGGYADLAQGCLWEYCIPLSSPCPCLPKPPGHGRLVAWGPSWFLRSM